MFFLFFLWDHSELLWQVYCKLGGYVFGSVGSSVYKQRYSKGYEQVVNELLWISYGS